MTTTRTAPAPAPDAPRVVAALGSYALGAFLEAERLADAIDSADWMADGQADAWADLADLGGL